jgi:hypothetical protein
LEQKINALQGIGQNLDNQRQPLAEVGSLGDKLQTILTDPASKSEIKGKVGQIERAFNNCRKKLDNALAELENADREGREFAAACAGMLLFFEFEFARAFSIQFFYEIISSDLSFLPKSLNPINKMELARAFSFQFFFVQTMHRILIMPNSPVLVTVFN